MKWTIPWAVTVLLTTLAGCDPAVSADAASAPSPAMPTIEVSLPEPGSARAEALLAMKHGARFVLYSIEPWTDRMTGSDTFSCRQGSCLAANAVLGRVEIVDADSLRQVRAALRDSLAQVPNFAAACIPEYRHAIGFEADGKRYRVFLCYECGQVGIEVDGKDVLDAGQTFEMGDAKALNAILDKAGVPLAGTARGAD